MTEQTKFQKFISKVNYLEIDIPKYFEELNSAYTNQNYRSTITLSWGIVVFYLYKKIEAFGFANFKTKKEYTFRTVYDLSVLSDDELITYSMQNKILVNATIRSSLTSLKVDRNNAAHVNQIEFDNDMLEAFLIRAIKVIELIETDIGISYSFNKQRYDGLDVIDLELYVQSLANKQKKIDLLNYAIELLNNVATLYNDRDFVNATTLKEDFKQNEKLKLTINYLFSNSGESKPDLEEIFVNNLVNFEDFDYRYILIEVLLENEFGSINSKAVLKGHLANFIEKVFLNCWDWELMKSPIDLLDKYWDCLTEKQKYRIKRSIDDRYAPSFEGMGVLCKFIIKRTIPINNFSKIKEEKNREDCKSPSKHKCDLSPCIFKEVTQ